MSAPDLGGLGVSQAEQRTYEVMLGQPALTFAELTYLMPLDRGELRTLLRSLEEKGLLLRITGRRVRYSAVRPDLAIEVLALRNQKQVEQARLVAMTLARRSQSTSDSAVRQETGHGGVELYFRQIQKSATEEVLILDKPPYVTDPGRSRDGVRCRTIYDRDLLGTAGQIEELRRLTACGAEARALSGVPMKLVIADRQVALVQHDPYDDQHVVPQRSSALTAALAAMFDMLWDRATPLWPQYSRTRFQAGLPAAGHEPLDAEPLVDRTADRTA